MIADSSGALTNPEQAIERQFPHQLVEQLYRDTGVRTVCVHGDNPEALAFGQTKRGSSTICASATAAATRRKRITPPK